MSRWSFDIIRQSGWDLWVLICIAASLTLMSYGLFGRPWRRGVRGVVAMLLVAIGVAGTAIILLTAALHTALAGMIWTFLLMCILSAVFYLNLVGQLGLRRTTVLLAIRVVALMLLVPMLFEPVISYVSRPKPERPLLFVIDTSGSMSFPDVQNGPTRVQAIWQALRPQLRRVYDHFVPKFYTFSTDIQELPKADELARLQADGKATDIAGAVTGALTKAGLNHAIVILISDGIDNASPDPARSLRASRRPVYTVRVGSEQAEPATLANVAVEAFDTPDDFVVGHESTMTATIKSTALANRVVDVKMAELDEEGKPIGEVRSKALVLQPLPEGQKVELPYKPAVVGVRRLGVWIEPIAGERSNVDNRQEYQGLALDPRIKVLYIEGRARSEHQQLVRALGRDGNIEAASLLRVQDDRFYASGTVDGSNFVRMPQTLEEWKKFDVIIIGDLEARFLVKYQQFLRDHVFAGGGLLMVGGESTFGPGEYKDTKIEEALPVFVGDKDSPQEKTEFVPRLTAEGATHPAMEGLAEWFGVENKKGEKTEQLEQRPLRGNVVVGKAKSGASVLLTHRDQAGSAGQIVLAVQRFGEGRSAACTVDTTWVWYLPFRGMGQDSPYNRFWGQIVRWLAGADVRNRQRGAGVQGLLNKTVYQWGESVHVRALVRDERGDATPFATVSAKLRQDGNKDGQPISIPPIEARRGMYEATIDRPDHGKHVLDLVAAKEGKELGRQQLAFTVIPRADELLKIAARPELLGRVASQTGGQAYDLSQLGQLIDHLIEKDRQALTAKTEVVPLANAIRAVLALIGRNPQWQSRYDLPMQAAIVLVLLTAEWVIRRRWQLP